MDHQGNGQHEIRLKGAPISQGIAIGKPIFLSPEAEEIPNFPITMGEVEGEIGRYRQALVSSREDLKRLHEDLTQAGSSEVAAIISTHIEMLGDPLMTTHMECKIQEMLKNTESVFHIVINDYERRLGRSKDIFFQQRLSDVKDLSRRVLRKLSDSHKVPFDQVPKDAIIFARELVPSDTASPQTSYVSAFVTQAGGGMSHAALIARAKGIPYVSNVAIDFIEKIKSDSVIVDGRTGDIILNPSQSTLEKYLALKKLLDKQYQQLENGIDLPSKTLDGEIIQLYANINHLGESKLASYHKVEGIGLFRSEYLFLQDNALLFDEERQYRIYEELLKESGSLSVTVRVMDLGGDKYMESTQEMKEQLMVESRGIQFLLKRKDIFKVQLRALLRAGYNYPYLRILFPFVTSIEELREGKRVVDEVREELLLQHIPFLKTTPIGCMLEVPSAVLICDALAEESDFLALGTNDLIQYTLGIDRTNFDITPFYHPTHPGILRMIHMVLTEGNKQAKPVTICGEMASNPRFTELLLGLGMRQFSCAPRFLPLIKKTLRGISLSQATGMAKHILSLKTSQEISAFLER
ncbi:phosphoenolpyruvate--protein phosphotransferase [Rhabdochlamydiaceae symbiont of Dictyostelium giganteum]|uniref:phosphoenolpyruvate--protein phosphotransferase n=1 Tax=Rhabdochlamydiaceae symbiont of Dictyostelium giganteum TaxID=3342349 RepID=UPI003850C2FB